MKRNAFIALAFILLCGLSNAQFREVKVADDLLNIKAKMPVMLPFPGGGSAVGELIPGQKVMDDVMVGTTWYDLQSYNTVQSRIYAYDDGTIGATYMRANDVGTWSERGSAYNYFDGNAWGPNPAGRIESVRTGWPCYAPLGRLVKS